MADEPARDRLDILAFLIGGPVADILETGIILRAADGFFARVPEVERKERFVTNPANTLPYRALVSLEHECVVQLSELLNDEHGILPTAAVIRGKEQLALHRHAISHPVTLTWHSKEKQEFHDEHRVFTDPRAPIVWDIQKSINDELRKRGQLDEVRNEDIRITHDMAAMLHLILRRSVRDAHTVPSEEALVEWLATAKKKYIESLEAMPSDGA